MIKHIETEMKRIHSSIEESNKQMLEMIKGNGCRETRNIRT